MKHPRKNKTLPLWAAVILPLVALELLFRILFAFKVAGPRFNPEEVLHRYSLVPGLVYEMKPAFSIIDSHEVVVRTNAFGMRDDEYTLEKPEDVFRICLIGDSVSFGMYLPLEKTFAKLLEKRLNAQDTGKFEVLNFAVAGYNSSQEAVTLKEKVLNFKPDMVIVAFCPNDDSYTDGLGAMSRAYSPISLGNQLHSRAFCFFAHHFEKNVLAKTTDMKRPRELLSLLASEKEKNKFQALVVAIPYYFEDYDRYKERNKHKMVRDIAQEKELSFLDFSDAWKNLDAKVRKDLYHNEDVVHLSALGMQSAAEGLFTFIDEIKGQGTK